MRVMLTVWFNQTVNITRIQVVNRTVINEGPRPEIVERAAGRRIEAMPVHQLRRMQETEVVAREPNIPSSIRRAVPLPARTEPVPPGAVSPRPPQRDERPSATTKPVPPLDRKHEIRRPAEPKPARSQDMQGMEREKPRFEKGAVTRDSRQ